MGNDSTMLELKIIDTTSSSSYHLPFPPGGAFVHSFIRSSFIRSFVHLFHLFHCFIETPLNYSHSSHSFQ